MNKKYCGLEIKERENTAKTCNFWQRFIFKKGNLRTFCNNIEWRQRIIKVKKEMKRKKIQYASFLM